MSTSRASACSAASLASPDSSARSKRRRRGSRLSGSSSASRAQARAAPAGSCRRPSSVNSRRRSSGEKGSSPLARSSRVATICGPPRANASWMRASLRSTRSPNFSPARASSPLASSYFCWRISSRAWTSQGRVSLGNRLRTSSSSARALASSPRARRRSTRNSAASADPGAAACASAISFSTSPHWRCAAGSRLFCAIKRAASGSRTAAGCSASSPRYSRIASSIAPRLIRSWIHPSRAVMSPGLAPTPRVSASRAARARSARRSTAPGGR